jgi:cysteine desulfurase
MTIYLDNAATTPVAPEVAEAVLRCMQREYGNPSSAHQLGIEAEREVKAARRIVLHALGDPDGTAGDVFWTSGGTESDALGVIGPARLRRRRARRVAISAIEHPAVRESAEMLAAEGFEVDTLPVGRDGVLEIDAALERIGDDTAVVAVMLVNNEIGTVQPVAELARRIAGRHPNVHVHCDAVQALGKIPIDARALGAHSIAFAAHKIHGPKGAGALWLAAGSRIAPLWAGGGQQEGVRSGTLNVPGIAGMGAAVGAMCANPATMQERARRYAGWARLLCDAAAASGVEHRINGDPRRRAPHILSLAFRGVPAEPLLHVLESRGVMVSAGSACSERDRKPSPVLSAIGLPEDHGTVRLSFGTQTTGDEVAEAAEILRDAVASF